MHGLHWESWLLRLALAGTLAFQLATRNPSGAIVAGQGLLVSLLPLLIQKLSKTHVPRPLEFAFVLGMALQYISESLKLFEVYYYWDKLVHPTLVALTALIAVWLVLGFRDAYQKRLPLHLAAAFGMLLGMCVGAVWEFVEFGSDWFFGANLQKSNADTLTDITANNIGAFVATLIGAWIYTHRLSERQRTETGAIAAWLGNGPRRLLVSHGRTVGTLLALVVAGVLFAARWIDRDTPALASGLVAGQSQTWEVSPDLAETQALRGDWVPDSRGICRMNVDQPKPGSEKMGLLELGPGATYGPAFRVQTQYFEERPPKVEGSQMDAGIAFGIRDADDFYVLEQSALHDTLRIDRYVHGKRRAVREALERTHGDEWHTLGLEVAGDRVTASLDGREVYSVSGLADTDGGIGIWGWTSAATCFRSIAVQVE